MFEGPASTIAIRGFPIAGNRKIRDARRNSAEVAARAGKKTPMSTTKAKLLESLPGFENQLSPEGRKALLQALQEGNIDSFIIVRSGDHTFTGPKKSFVEAGVHYVALSDADAAVLFEGWENSPLHASFKNESVRPLPMLIVHEA
jgi:hypothetical protein